MPTPGVSNSSNFAEWRRGVDSRLRSLAAAIARSSADPQSVTSAARTGALAPLVTVHLRGRRSDEVSVSMLEFERDDGEIETIVWVE